MTAVAARELTVRFPKLLPMQRTLRNHPARFKVVAAGRRSGKTRYGVISCLEVALAGGNAWWVAPTYKVARIGWRQIVQAGRQIPGTEIRLADHEIILPGGGRIGVRSDDGDKRGALRGEALDHVVLDEAAYIAEVSWRDALRPSLTDRKGTALFISTPAGFNWFHDLWQRAGREDAESWAQFKYPTSSNPYIDPAELEEARLELGSHTYSQEYLADFVELGGGIIKAEWLRYWRWPGADLDEATLWESDEAVPGDLPLPTIVLMAGKDGAGNVGREGRAVSVARCQRLIVVDPALSTKETADYTAIGAFAVTPDRKLILLEMFRNRIESPEVLKHADRLRRKWRAPVMYFESVAYQKSLVQQGRRAGMPIRELKADKDKVARAMTLGARAEGGDVYLPSDPGDAGELERELTVFPDGAHDDQLDVMAYGAILLPDLAPSGRARKTSRQLTTPR